MFSRRLPGAAFPCWTLTPNCSTSNQRIHSCNLNQMPLLNTTLPASPPFSQKSSSRLNASTLCRCGNAAKANGKAKRLVPKIKPKLIGNVSLGFFFSHSCFCSRTSIKGGITIIGELFKTLLRAVSETASVAAFLLFPKEATEDSDFPSSASLALSDSERTG
jgi:hypothetical protein